VDTADLLAAVAREFEVTGAATPSWSDPHEGMDGPRSDEYSRCLDPGKYRIVGARTQAWAGILVAAGLATAEPVRDPATVWQEAARQGDHVRLADHGTWLRPHAAGALPLLLATRSIGAPDNHVDIGAGDPPRLLEDVPDCGCDACDSGSAGLLEQIDAAVLDVVSGALVHVRIGETTAMSGLDRWSAHTRGPETMPSRSAIDAAFAAVRAGDWPGPALHGPAWW
jgi:hypothetical protein